MRLEIPLAAAWIAAPIGLTLPVTAQTDDEAPQRQHALGGWGGLRGSLEDNGVIPEIILHHDASWLASGGRNPRSSAFRWLLDVSVTVETEVAIGLPGGRFFADVQFQRGDDGSLDTGDLQVYSNIDSDDRTQLAELWYRQNLCDDALRIKVGKMDANADFALVDYGAVFVHSSFGFSPTILNLPTYPDPSFGALAFVQGDHAYLGAGIYDGALQSGVRTGLRGTDTILGRPQDVFTIAEAGLLHGSTDTASRGRIAIGAWHNSGTLDRFDGGTEDGTSGYYATLEQQLWRPQGEEDGERGIGLLAQYGWADEALSAIEHHVGIGLNWTGPCSERPEDTLAIGASWASFSNASGAGLVGDAELAIELLYGFQARPWLRLLPEVQWIRDPGGQGFDDAWVFTLRAAVLF